MGTQNLKKSTFCGKNSRSIEALLMKHKEVSNFTERVILELMGRDVHNTFNAFKITN